MTGRIGILLLILLAVLGCAHSKPTVTTEVSPSGIWYTLVTFPSTDDVAIEVAWETDWAFRDGVNQAVPIVGRDLLFDGGADGYPAGQSAELFADLKAEAYINISSDIVFGVLKFKRPVQDKVVQVANAHLRSPSFDEHWFERARRSLARVSQEENVRVQSKLFDTEGWAVLGSQPLRAYLSNDKMEMLQALRLSDLKVWHTQTFTRSPKAVVVAGNLSPGLAGPMIDQLFQGLPTQSQRQPKKVDLNFKARRILVHAPEAAISQILFVKPLPPTRQGKELEDMLITTALGQGSQSMLFKVVRNELGTSYDFNSGIDAYSRDIRLFYMFGTVDTGKLAETEQNVRHAYSSFLKSGPPGEFASWVELFFHSVEVRSQTPEALADTVLQAIMDDQPASRALNLREELERITLESVKTRLAEAYPLSDDFLVVAISPDAGAMPGACVVRFPQDATKC